MTAPLPDDLPPERPIYQRGTPEYRAAWLQAVEQRRQAARESNRRYRAQSAVRRQAVTRTASPRQHTEPLTPEQLAERLRVLAERRLANAAHTLAAYHAKRAQRRQKATENDQ